jgi:tetratricopeptide (TPR) repeat protein
VEQPSPIQEIESLMRQQQWEAAALACHAELDLHPTAARVHGYLGMSLFRLSRFSDAIVSFRRAIALDPNFWEAGAKLAQCLTQTRQYEEAYKEVMHWLPKQPNDHTLQGLAEFLRPMVHGETQRWERTMNLERKIVMPNK